MAAAGGDWVDAVCCWRRVSGEGCSDVGTGTGLRQCGELAELVLSEPCMDKRYINTLVRSCIHNITYNGVS